MRNTARKIAGLGGSWIPQSLLTRISRQKFVFPYYHAVADQRSIQPHLRHVFPVRSRRAFLKDLDYLLARFLPAGLDVLAGWQQDPGKLKKPHFLLSFDDGLREVYEQIAPVLLQKGVPAIIFVNTDFVDNRDLFYRYKISLILDRLEVIGYSRYVTEVLQSRFGLAGNSRGIIRAFIRGITYNRKEILDEIAGLLNVDFNTFLKVRQPYMSSGQIRELAGKGFCIGAHGRDHPCFGELDEDRQWAQITESVEYVKKNYGQQQGLFAFPFGDGGTNPAIFRRMRESGEILASFGTAGLKKQSIPWHHQRIPMEALRLPCPVTLKGEYLYYLMKAPLGKNTRRR